MEKHGKLKNFTNLHGFSTQSFSEAKKHMKTDDKLVAYVVVKNGVVRTSLIVDINVKESYFITKSGNKYIITEIDNEVKEIELTGFYNRTRNEILMGYDLQAAKQALESNEHLQATFYYGKYMYGISSKVIELDLDKKLFYTESGSIYHFKISS